MEFTNAAQFQDVLDGMPRNQDGSIIRGSAHTYIVGLCGRAPKRTKVRKLAIACGMPGADAVSIQDHGQIATFILDKLLSSEPIVAAPAPPPPPAEVPHEERLRLIQHVRGYERTFVIERKPEAWWASATIDALNLYKVEIEQNVAAGDTNTSGSEEEVSEMVVAPTPTMDTTQPQPQPIIPNTPMHTPMHTPVYTGERVTTPTKRDEWDGIIADLIGDGVSPTVASPTGFTCPQFLCDKDQALAWKLWVISCMDPTQTKKVMGARDLVQLLGRTGLECDGVNARSTKPVLLNLLQTYLLENSAGILELAETPEPCLPENSPTEVIEEYSPIESASSHAGAYEERSGTQRSSENIDPNLITGEEARQILLNQQQVFTNQLKLWENVSSIDAVLAEMAVGMLRVRTDEEPLTCASILKAMKQ